MEREDENDSWNGQEQRQRRRRESDDVEIRTAFGSVRTRGKQASTILVAVIIAAVIVLFLRQYDENRSHHDAQVDLDHKALAAKLDEMVYIISLPEKERAEITLSMPESLRNKMRNERYQR